MKKTAVSLAALGLLATLAGCGSEPAKDVPYSSVQDFRDAYVAAGFDCPESAGPVTELDLLFLDHRSGMRSN